MLSQNGNSYSHDIVSCKIQFRIQSKMCIDYCILQETDLIKYNVDTDIYMRCAWN